MNEENFLGSQNHYYGQPRKEDLIFSSKLKEFSEAIDMICALQRDENMTSQEAYEEMELLWKSLSRSKTKLKVHKDCRVKLSHITNMRIKLVKKKDINLNHK
ncbi:MAG: hypothetical protein KME29_13280 [Calothrix sp. FI2-JRJ7]|jgi:uncharacterized protein (UPF0305 family)|nr:hypothetical protein [Calothrix sp. FI2-JRJ7]